MRKHVSKLLATILAVVFFAFPVLGCSNDEEDLGDFDGVIYVSARLAGFGKQWLEELKDKYQKEKNIKVVLTIDTNMINTLTNAMNVNREGYLDDLYIGCAPRINWHKWYKEKKLYPIESPAILEHLDSEYREYGTAEDDKLYFLMDTMAITGFVYNQDYLDKIATKGDYTCGVFPTTMQGLYDMISSMKDNSEFYSGGKWVIAPLSYGGSKEEPEGVLKTLFAQGNDSQDFLNYWNQTGTNSTPDRDLYVNDSLLNALTALYKMLDPGNGYSKNALDGSPSLSHTDSELKFLQGKVVFCPTGSWFESEMSSMRPSAPVKNYKFAPVPSIDPNAEKRVVLTNAVEGSIIPKNADNPQLAVDFLEFMSRPDNVKRTCELTTTPSAYNYEIGQNELANATEWYKSVMNAFNNNKVVKPPYTTALARSSMLEPIIFTSGGSGAKAHYMISSGQWSESDLSTALERSYDGACAKWDEWRRFAGIIK